MTRLFRAALVMGVRLPGGLWRSLSLSAPAGRRRHRTGRHLRHLRRRPTGRHANRLRLPHRCPAAGARQPRRPPRRPATPSRIPGSTRMSTLTAIRFRRSRWTSTRPRTTSRRRYLQRRQPARPRQRAPRGIRQQLRLRLRPPTDRHSPSTSRARRRRSSTRARCSCASASRPSRCRAQQRPAAVVDVRHRHVRLDGLEQPARDLVKRALALAGQPAAARTTPSPS